MQLPDQAGRASILTADVDGRILEERAQAKIRLLVSVTLMVVVIVIALANDQHPISAYGYLVPIISLHGCACLCVWYWCERSDAVYLWRMLTSASLDFAVTTLALIKMGPYAGVVWLVYLWIIVGNGMRFGVRYLFAMTGLALSFSSVLYLFDGFWFDHWSLALSLQGGLLLVPLCYSGVIGHVHKLHAMLKDDAAASRTTALAKAQFLANMSHELRTPMNGVLGVAELLEPRIRDPEDRELMALLKRSGQALVGVIDDILDFSKLDAGRVKLESLDIDLVSVVADVVTLFQPNAVEKGLTLYFEHPNTPLHVRGDDTRLRQVFSNLISNAVKFTDQGTVRVTLVVNASHGGTHDIDIAVQDSGVGIAPDQLGRVFEQFEQADVSTTRRFGGTGLGLAISKRLVELMGGKLTAESSPGQGSTFRVSVVLPTGQTPQAPRPTVAQAYGYRALVAEDNPVNQVVIAKLLERLEIKAKVVSDGDQAVRVAAKEAFDVIFMDLQMPVMGGVDAARLIRARCDNTPIIALSADVLSLDQDEATDLFDGFIAKPVKTEALTAHLDQIVALRQRQQGLVATD